MTWMPFTLTLSPLTHRKWGLFKANKRAFWSLWLFGVLLITSLLANVIANDRPLVVLYKGSLYMPLVVTYPETTFGGSLPLTTDYKDPAVSQHIRDHGWMIWPLIRYSYDTVNYLLPSPAPSPPDAENWLGTDDQGRDILARLIYGFRVSVVFGLMLTLLAGSLGVIVGGIQGYLGGRVDLVTQRITEIWMSLPLLYMIIVLTSFVKPSFGWLLAILILFKWTALVAVVRAEFLKARNYDYVRAARAMGLTPVRILWRHMLPNAMVAALTLLPFVLNGAIGTLTSLDFLGFGLPPGSASLGEILSQGKHNLHAPWIGISGFLTVALLLSLLTFIGEGVRDAFDPRKLSR